MSIVSPELEMSIVSPEFAEMSIVSPEFGNSGIRQNTLFCTTMARRGRKWNRGRE
jgi:hypothetical protein